MCQRQSCAQAAPGAT